MSLKNFYTDDDSQDFSDLIEHTAEMNSTSRLIEYFNIIQKENKLSNRLTLICTILAAIFSGISAIFVIIDFFSH